MVPPFAPGLFPSLLFFLQSSFSSLAILSLVPLPDRLVRVHRDSHVLSYRIQTGLDWVEVDGEEHCYNLSATTKAQCVPPTFCTSQDYNLCLNDFCYLGSGLPLSQNACIAFNSLNPALPLNLIWVPDMVCPSPRLL